MMRRLCNFYVDGKWIVPAGTNTHPLVDPATEEISGTILMANEADVQLAVRAARRAFAAYSLTSTQERMAILDRIAQGIEKRRHELAMATSKEMGAPFWLADAVVSSALSQIQVSRQVLEEFSFNTLKGPTLWRWEAIGVCALITPWNWPLGTVLAKLAPALGAGCTVVLKPSEYAAISATLLAEIVHDAEVLPGVFNLILGDGAGAGATLAAHPDVDMVTFTGSTRAGIEIAKAGAATIKRVHQELGGKSPNIILPSADFQKAVRSGIRGAMINSGQACVAPTRMLVPTRHMQDIEAIAVEVASELTVGPPDSNAFIGPLVNARQWQAVQNYICAGINEGARLLFGGPGKPPGLDKGYYVKPTIFVDTDPKMRIVKEEIFGPVLVMQEYETIEDAIELANDTMYGLGAYIFGNDLAELQDLATKIPAGQVYLNGTGMDLNDPTAPFGGFKRSGNGRERGVAGLEAFLELKAILGYRPSANN